MENERITVKRIYTSRLSKRLVSYGDDELKWEKTQLPKPTGFQEIDFLMRELAKIPIPSCSKLAAASGVPPRTFKQLVRFRTGLQFSVFINRYRFEAAAELLRCTNLGLQEIIRLVGTSEQTIHRHFKRIYGETPLNYRRLERPEGYRLFYRYETERQ